MKPQAAPSRDIIDRRKRVLGASFIVALLGLVGIKAFTTGSANDPDRDVVGIVSAALDRGQVYWEHQIPGYRHAHVLLYETSTATACGVGLTSSGPFYCPGDERIYVDLSFVRAIHGDLARAYVIEHELGHHVQKLRDELDRAGSIPTELEADCYAGELMRQERTSGNLDATDVPGALAEAAAVGDDRLMPGSSPETWSHGSSSMRVGAVQAGLAGIGCHL